MSGQPPIDGGRTVTGTQSLRVDTGLQTQSAARQTFTFPRKIIVDDTKCSICQEDFNSGTRPEIPIAIPGCGHVFGSVCISQWLHTARRNHGCPLCRKNPFERLPENAIDEGDEVELNEEDEEDDPAEPMTPIDASLALSDLADEFQGWEPFQLTNNGSQPLVEDEAGIIEDSTAAALRYFLGDYPSTEAVIDVVRAGQRDNYILAIELAVEDIVDDHRHLFAGATDQRPSYPSQTRQAYRFVQTAFRYAARWLREQPPHNDIHLQILYVALANSLRAKAADWRFYDIVRLTDLIKAGIFSSPRMEGSFNLRMRMSQHVPGDIDSLRRRSAKGEPRPYMARWMRAMPLLAAGVRLIAETERFRPLRIIEIDCERLWKLDMEAAPPVALPIRTPSAAEPMLDLPSPPAIDPIVPPLGSPAPVDSESDSNRTMDNDRDDPQLDQNISNTESDMTRLRRAVQHAAVAANDRFRSLQPS